MNKVEFTKKFLLTCENVLNAEKLSLINIFEKINALSLPAGVPSLNIVGKIVAEGSSAKVRNISVELKITDPDGNNEPFKLAEEISYKLEPFKGKTEIGVIINAPNLVFTKEGNYKFILIFDGVPVGDCDLEICKVEKL